MAHKKKEVEKRQHKAVKAVKAVKGVKASKAVKGVKSVKAVKAAKAVKRVKAVKAVKGVKASKHKSVKKSHSKGKAKVEKVMHEFKEHKLHSGSKKGPEVTSPKQAIAIALSEARKSGAKVPKKKAHKKKK